MKAAAFFDRIDFHGPIEPTAATLRAIHGAHLRAVPFENLDIHLKRPLSLIEADLFDKIVTRRRGGFCYELNGLFAQALREMGFDVTLLSARTINNAGSLSFEFDHLVLMVQAPDAADRWLADVGFGDSFLEPLRLAETGWQLQINRAFKIDRAGDTYRLFMRDDAGHIEPQFAFTLQPRHLNEFAGMCRYHQTSPGSSFTRKRICTLAMIDGRITLSDLNFITTLQHQRVERMLRGEEEYEQILRDKFGIVL